MIVYIERLAIEACSMPSQELPMKKVLEHYTKGILYCNHIIIVCILGFLLFSIAPALLRQASYGTLKMGLYQRFKRLLSPHHNKGLSNKGIL